MSGTRKQLEATSSTNLITIKLVKKIKKTTMAEWIKAKKAWSMYEYYAEKESSMDDQLNALAKVIEILNGYDLKTSEENDLFEKAVVKHHNLLGQILKNLTKEYEENKESGEYSASQLIKQLEKIIRKVNCIQLEEEGIESLLANLDEEHDNLCYSEAKKLKNSLTRVVNDDDKLSAIDLLLEEIKFLERIKNKTEECKALLVNEIKLLDFLNAEQELKEIEGEIARFEELLIDNRRNGRSIADQLVAIAELNEAMSPLYESIGQVEKQLNVLLTAKLYLDQLPANDRRKAGLYEEIEEAINEIKDDKENHKNRNR